MRQNGSGFGTFLLILIAGALLMCFWTYRNLPQDSYTREEFMQDVEAGNVKGVEINPNPEVPTGSLTVTTNTEEVRHCM